MNCRDIQALLPEYSHQDLGPEAEILVNLHLQSCRTCTAIVQRERQLQASLKSLPVAELPAGFAAKAMRRAREEASAQDRRRVGTGLAMAASVLMVAGLAFMLGRGTSAVAPENTVNLAMGQTQMVALKIDAPQAFEQVKFEVSLPANVALAEQPELREFAWSGQLQAGVNVLSLPLVGINPDSGHLIATVTYGKTRRSLDVPLFVAAEAKGMKS